ncbi:MAG: elongation factor P hydroxylase [Halioglobus sp.]
MGSLESLLESRCQDFSAARLEQVFNRCFYTGWNTRLYGGADEPLYRPASSSDNCHALHYRHDFFASALHEVAHWCIAGEERRQQLDFGYWYAPEGRSAEQQRAFEAVECKPQALEWFFSRACGYRFRLSADNLNMDTQEMHDSSAFQLGVLAQAKRWQVDGLPQRAQLFYRALCVEFGTTDPADQLCFDLADLQ